MLKIETNTREDLENEVLNSRERLEQTLDAWKQSKYSEEYKAQVNIAENLLNKAESKLIAFIHKNFKIGDGVTVITKANNKYSYTIIDKKPNILKLKRDLAVKETYTDEDGFEVARIYIEEDYYGAILNVYWDKKLKRYSKVYGEFVNIVEGREEELSYSSEDKFKYQTY